MFKIEWEKMRDLLKSERYTELGSQRQRNGILKRKKKQKIEKNDIEFCLLSFLTLVFDFDTGLRHCHCVSGRRRGGKGEKGRRLIVSGNLKEKVIERERERGRGRDI